MELLVSVKLTVRLIVISVFYKETCEMFILCAEGTMPS